MALPYILTNGVLNIVIDGEQHTVTPDHRYHEKILDALKNDDLEDAAVLRMINLKRGIEDFVEGAVEVKDGILLYKGEELHNSITVRILDMLEEGFDGKPMINFLDNLMSNPSKTAVQELYGFLEKGALPLTSDGHFLAYKKIKGDYTDCHTGKINNSIGTVVKMPRNEVDDDRNRTCSAGLHFCSLDYLDNFGGDRVVAVKINPANVVSIPSDYNNTKGRCCEYEVLLELDKDKADEAFEAKLVLDLEAERVVQMAEMEEAKKQEELDAYLEAEKAKEDAKTDPAD